MASERREPTPNWTAVQVSGMGNCWSTTLFKMLNWMFRAYHPEKRPALCKIAMRHRAGFSTLSSARSPARTNQSINSRFAVWCWSLVAFPPVGSAELALPAI